MKRCIVKNGRLVLRDEILDDHYLVIRDGVIQDITDRISSYTRYETIDAEGGWVTPGLVEMHIHGCSRWCFEDLSEGTLSDIHHFLAARGINTYLPTMQCSETALKNLVNAIKRHPEFSIPGIYIEGPFINPDKRGGILREYIRDPDCSYLQHIHTLSEGLLRMMTFAPELEGSELIFQFLQENHVIPALGHSLCSFKQAEAFVGQGILNLTHLFNAMSGISHKDPGLAMLPFKHRDVFYELNSDGVHVANACVDMCYQHLHHDHCVLITDAVVSAGDEYGCYHYYHNDVVSSKRGVRYKSDDTLTGSNHLIPQVMKRFLDHTGCSIPDVVKFATWVPARLLGLSDQQGSLEIGKRADIVILDHEFQCRQNLCH